ncbi:MAG: pitrilysin family protein [Paracoccaceae bacterium]
MIRFLFAAVFCVFALPAAAEVKIAEITSPGGIKAWLVEEHGIPFTALELRFRGGTSLDAPDKRGAVMLMAALLEEGADGLDSRGFAERREELAARIGFDANADAVTVSVQMLTENRDEVVKLLKSALTNPRFDQDAIDRVKGQIQSIIHSHAASPDDIARETMDAALYGDHPYGSSDLGTAESAAALTRDDLLAARAATMARDRLYVSAVGDITGEELGKLLDGLLGDLPATGAPLPAPVTPAFPGGVTVVPFDTPQSVILFGQPGVPWKNPDYYPAYVLNQILGGGGFTARLMTEVREKRGLTYGVSTNLVNMDLADSWQGSLASSNDKAGEAVKVIRDVWADVAAKGVTEAELEAAKTYMTGSYPLRFDGNDNIARILVGMQMDGFPIDYPAHRNDKIAAVTLEDVNRVARERMRPDRLTFTVVGHPVGLESTN